MDPPEGYISLAEHDRIVAEVQKHMRVLASGGNKKAPPVDDGKQTAAVREPVIVEEDYVEPSPALEEEAKALAAHIAALWPSLQLRPDKPAPTSAEILNALLTGGQNIKIFSWKAPDYWGSCDIAIVRSTPGDVLIHVVDYKYGGGYIDDSVTATHPITAKGKGETTYEYRPAPSW